MGTAVVGTAEACTREDLWADGWGENQEMHDKPARAFSGQQILSKRPQQSDSYR